MSLWELADGKLRAVAPTSFATEGIREREDLQAVLRDAIEAVAPDTLVIAEEFSDWEEARLRIDLLGVDRDANLVVVELKRTESGGHSELQGVRYASMVASMTFEQAVTAYERYRVKRKLDPSQAESDLLEFLAWDEPDEERFGSDVRIVLASGDFSLTLSSAVLWLRDRGVDIRCVRMKPHRLEDSAGHRLLIEIEQVIPLPEAAAFQVRVARKAQAQRDEREASKDLRRFDLAVNGQTFKRLAKNRTAFEIVRVLIEQLAVEPSRIIAGTTEGKRRAQRPILVGFEGELTGEEVRDKLGTRALRYFSNDNDLMHSLDHTWVFTNQWSGGQVELLISELNDQYDSLNVDYQTTES